VIELDVKPELEEGEKEIAVGDYLTIKIIVTHLNLGEK